MKKPLLLLWVAVSLLSCDTVKVINTDSEPVPVKVTGQPIKTTITNDLSSITVNNTQANPVPVQIMNPPTGNSSESKIFFRKAIVSAAGQKMSVEPLAADIITGTLPSKPFNYVITAVYGNDSYCPFFANNNPQTIKFTENVLGFLPFNTNEAATAQPNGGVTIVGYVFK